MTPVFPVSDDPAAFANAVLSDPKLLEQLTEKVYSLLQENLRQQQDQHKPYGCGRI